MEDREERLTWKVPNRIRIIPPCYWPPYLAGLRLNQQKQLFLLIDSIFHKKHDKSLFVSILFTIFEPLIY
jgi:hypothetical protein